MEVRKYFVQIILKMYNNNKKTVQERNLLTDDCLRLYKQNTEKRRYIYKLKSTKVERKRQ